MGQGIVGHVAEARRPLVVSDVSENKMHLKAIQDAVGFTARNLVALPIVIRGRIYGVLELLNRIGENDYTPADVELLTYACEMAAKAIEARLMIAWSAKRRARGEGEAA
jgi:GAF domain-containing protein